MGAGTSALHLCFEMNWKCPRPLLFFTLVANTFCFLLNYHFVADVYSYAKDLLCKYVYTVKAHCLYLLFVYLHCF